MVCLISCPLWSAEALLYDGGALMYSANAFALLTCVQNKPKALNQVLSLLHSFLHSSFFVFGGYFSFFSWGSNSVYGFLSV